MSIHSEVELFKHMCSSSLREFGWDFLLDILWVALFPILDEIFDFFNLDRGRSGKRSREQGAGELDYGSLH